MTAATLQMFNALTQDMALQRSYAKNKNAVMRAFGLGRAEMETLNTGSDADVKKLLNGAEPLCFMLGLTRSSKSE